MPKSLALRSREAGKACGETGDAEVEDLAIQDWALRKKRRIAMRAKERPVTQAAQCRAKCLYFGVAVNGSSYHLPLAGRERHPEVDAEVEGGED